MAIRRFFFLASGFFVDNSFEIGCSIIAVSNFGTSAGGVVVGNFEFLVSSDCTLASVVELAVGIGLSREPGSENRAGLVKRIVSSWLSSLSVSVSKMTTAADY